MSEYYHQGKIVYPDRKELERLFGPLSDDGNTIGNQESRTKRRRRVRTPTSLGHYIITTPANKFVEPSLLNPDGSDPKAIDEALKKVKTLITAIVLSQLANSIDNNHNQQSSRLRLKSIKSAKEVKDVLQAHAYPEGLSFEKLIGCDHEGNLKETPVSFFVRSIIETIQRVLSQKRHSGDEQVIIVSLRALEENYISVNDITEFLYTHFRLPPEKLPSNQSLLLDRLDKNRS